jgi:hypothetical protein
MRFMKPLAAGLALTIAATSLVGSAEARHRRHHHRGDALAAGILGFTAGALLSGALARPRYYDYYEPAPVYRARPPVVYETVPVYYSRPDPWTPEWYAYCSDRYRSFDEQTGYFLGYDGNYHFCN